MRLPKPPKRSPKERKPLQRSPIPRRSAPRKIMPRCKHCAHPAGIHPQSLVTGRPAFFLDRPSCGACSFCPGYEPARGIRQKRRTPAAAIRDRADHLWSAIVHARPERCEVQDYHPHQCGGGFQAMHGIPRTYKVTRFLPINGFKGCRDIHKYFTEHPEEWAAVTLLAWGELTFRTLWADARSMREVDMEATVASLRAEAKARRVA